MCNRWVEILILGGGPSGCATALALAHLGRSVAILERSKCQTGQVGEMLPQEIRSPLEVLGLWTQFLRQGHVASPGTISAWGRPDPYVADFITNPFGCGWHVDRRVFDAMLVSAAREQGVIILSSSQRLSFVRNSRVWCFETKIGETMTRTNADVIIDATGRSAWLSHQLGARRIANDRLIGLVAIQSKRQETEVDDRRTLVEAVEDGWWYTIPLAASGLMVGFMTDADLLPKDHLNRKQFWSDRLRSASYTAARLGETGLEISTRTVSACSTQLDEEAGDGWLAVGDAVATMDPLSSQGVFHALVTGIDGASAVDEWLRGDRRSLRNGT